MHRRAPYAAPASLLRRKGCNACALLKPQARDIGQRQMKIDAVDRAETGKAEVMSETRESGHCTFDKPQAEFLIQLADERGFRRLADIYRPAETSPMVRIEDVRPRIAQLQNVAPVRELNESRGGVCRPEDRILRSRFF